MSLPGTVEITYNLPEPTQPPTTAIYFDMLEANTAIQRLTEMGLEITKLEVIP